jgi:type VI secretion system protein ImpK
MATLFEQMGRKCREASIGEADASDARYAICAFADEQIFRSAWPGRAQWMAQPLQLVYFNENTAGEGFFTRMQAAGGHPSRAHVLQVYFLCLGLGFQGKYAIRGGDGLSAIIDFAGSQLARVVGTGEVISPHGLPNDPVRGFVRRELPIVALGIGFFLLALVVFVVLRIVLSSTLSTATTEIKASSASTVSAKP